MFTNVIKTQKHNNRQKKKSHVISVKFKTLKNIMYCLEKYIYCKSKNIHMNHKRDI